RLSHPRRTVVLRLASLVPLEPYRRRAIQFRDSRASTRHSTHSVRRASPQLAFWNPRFALASKRRRHPDASLQRTRAVGEHPEPLVRVVSLGYPALCTGPIPSVPCPSGCRSSSEL